MDAYILSKGEGKPGKVYHPAQVKRVPIPKIGAGQVLVKIKAAALNHRDLFIRQGLYAGIAFDSVQGADGAGVVIEPKNHPLYGKAVLISSSVGWDSDEYGPDDPKQPFGILGSQKTTQGRGTFAEYIALDEKYAFPCPKHWEDRMEQAASFPLAALTAYRATFTKGRVAAGKNVLITGIGGGVAIQALQFAVAAGANVWVTSSSQEKINRAILMGAKGGVNYKDENWPAELVKLLPKENPKLEVIIDSAGGPIINQTVRFLKEGAIVSCYGQTIGQPIPLPMTAVIRNIELKGSTMGSLDEFRSAIKFAEKHSLMPVVDKVFKGLGQAEEAFNLMKSASQFGKIVISIDESPISKL